MRRFFISGVMVLGYATLWAGMLQPATQPVSSNTSPAMSKALFLCHRQQNLGQTCMGALVNALVAEQSTQPVIAAADWVCHVGPRSRKS
jgi:hypothetical protein